MWQARASSMTRARLVLLWAVLLLLLILMTCRVAYVELYRGEYLSKRADELHNRERTLEARRGDIVDRNGVVLATSATVYRISVIHAQLEDPEKTAQILAQELEQEYETVYEKVQKKVALQVLATKVDTETAERIRSYELPGVMIDENYKRYYPYGNLAAQTLGFVGSDNQGIVGLEVEYDEYLTGIDGELQSLTDARGIALDGIGDEKIEPVSGHTLQTSLDVSLQQYAQQLIANVVEQKNAKRGALIAMNPKTGEILAMANVPDYDLNDPFTIQDEELAQIWDTLDETTQMEYLNQMWRNYCINDTYEPGSTFKIVTATAALSENVVKLTDTFHCAGRMTVADRIIRCHKTTGHGTETFVQGVQNSCNPVFMTLAERLGVETFYKYLRLFEFDQKTGIDVPGEAVGILYKEEDVGAVELATMGFGQSLTITPMQLLRAAAAVVNGGTLVTPHFGTAILDEDGQVLKTLEYASEEAVIDPEISETMRQVLETVVTEGGGTKAQVAGYSIGGKTATSQKLPRSARKYISSFMGFAPADDPELIVLVLVDEPEGIYYGGTVCAPVASQFFENALPYLGIEPDYTEEELEEGYGSVVVPDVTGMIYEEAATLAGQQGIELEVLGVGDTVAEQFPVAGEKMNKESRLILYLE